MQKRASRITLLALLFASGIGAGLLVWGVERETRALVSSQRAVAAHLGRLAELVASLATAQQAYGSWRQTDEHWFRHIAELVELIYAESAPVSAHVKPGEPSQHLRAFSDATGVMVQATARARDNLGLGRGLMAADLLLGETREHVEAMSSSLEKLRMSQWSAIATERAALDNRSWRVVGVVAGLWAVGLMTLGRTHATRAPESLTQETPALALGSAPAVSLAEVSRIDLPAAAELCTAISRIATADGLPDLLARTAAVIDASGVILWMSSGEKLFAVSSFGYDAGVIDRVSPILLDRQSCSLATETWHAGQTRTARGDIGSNGAIVAPMWGPAERIGLLAAEVRQGRENEVEVRAAVEMFAAQFAMTLAPLPAASAETTSAGYSLDPLDELPLRATGA